MAYNRKYEGITGAQAMLKEALRKREEERRNNVTDREWRDRSGDYTDSYGNRLQDRD